MKKYILLTMSILLIFSLVGCNKGNTSESTESQNTQQTTETTESSSSESTETTSEDENEKIEFIAIVDSINENGIIVYPKEDTCELWDIDEKFYINSEDVAVTKNGKTSIYDIVYFYDGLIISFNGTFDAKSSYTVLVPNDKINIDLRDEYKELNIVEDEDRDETPIDIIDQDEMKANVEFNSIFCKFEYPGKYEDIIATSFKSDSYTKRDIIGIAVKEINEHGREFQTPIMNITRVSKEGKINPNIKNEISYENEFIFAETNNYYYLISFVGGSSYGTIKKDLVDSIVKSVTIIE